MIVAVNGSILANLRFMQWDSTRDNHLGVELYRRRAVRELWKINANTWPTVRIIPQPGEKWIVSCDASDQAFVVEGVSGSEVVMINGSRFTLSEFQNKPFEWDKPRWDRSRNQ